MYKYFLLIGLGLSSFLCQAQGKVRDIPNDVKESFTEQYPSAQEVTYKDALVQVNVHFVLNGEKMVASYNNKGYWKGTEKDWTFDKLRPAVKDGFDKSRYTGWTVDETKILYIPSGVVQYRLRVRKNDLQKKYLFFNMKGRLLREAITI